MTAIVAPVTASPTAKLHLDIKGRAHCGAGDRVTIYTSSIPLANATAAQLCKRCIKAIRTAADEDLRNYAGGHSYYRSSGTIGKLRALREKLRTPQEIRNDNAFKADYAELVATTQPAAVTAPAVELVPALATVTPLTAGRREKPLSPWGQMLAANRRAAAEALTGQLANAA
jgi:hypothetical protein